MRVRLYEMDTESLLRDRERVFDAFLWALRRGDHESALEVLVASLSVLSKSKLARLHKLPRRTAYNLLQGKNSPNLKQVAKIVAAIEQEAKQRGAPA
ncbi:MAG: hypothetical protein V3S11_00470 [Elusimicrobiota bacterium]